VARTSRRSRSSGRCTSTRACSRWRSSPSRLRSGARCPRRS
jgi:hypothetical protein